MNDSPILIVEDSPDDYEACVAAFEVGDNFANPIHWCQTGDEALNFLFKRENFLDAPEPKIILLDLNIPGPSGFDVLARIKQSDHLRKIPVIVMTSSSEPADIDKCYEQGANSYVVKPVTLSGFIESVSRLRDYWFSIAVLPKEP